MEVKRLNKKTKKAGSTLAMDTTRCFFHLSAGRIPLNWTEGRLLDCYHYTCILNGIKRGRTVDALWGKC